MALPALAIPALIGGAQAAVGLIKGDKAKEEAARLAASRPDLEASPFIADQLSLAQSELSTGMSGDTERAYEEGLSRDISSSLDAILKGGGDVNNVAELFDRSSAGRQRLALMKENLRLSQINNLVNAQNAAENQRKEMFEFNEWRPWADAAQANAAARQGSENMIWSGLQTLGGAATGFLQGQQAKNDFANFFNVPQQATASPTMRPSTVSSVPMNTGGFTSPGANLNYINPGYASSIIDDSIFQ